MAAPAPAPAPAVARPPLGPPAEGWDPASNPVSFVINGNKVERNNNNADNFQVIRAAQGFSVANGRPSVEFCVEIRNRAGGGVAVGVITASSVINNANRTLGDDDKSCAYYAHEGRIVANNAAVHGNLRIAESGALIVVRLDCTANTATFYIRGARGMEPLGQAVPVPANVELFPAVSLNRNQAEVQLSYNPPYQMKALREPPNLAQKGDTWLRNTRDKVESAPYRLNVLVLSDAGDGASAFVQTVATACSSSETEIFQHHDLIVRPCSTHATTRLTVVDLMDADNKEHGLSLWNPWGSRPGDRVPLTPSIRQHLFDGQLLPGFEMPTKDADLPHRDHPFCNMAAEAHLAMQAVILVISAERFVDGVLPQPVLDRMKETVQHAKRHLFNQDPIIVISNVDKIDSAVAADPFAIYRSESLDRIVDYLSRSALEVAASNIFPLRLYFAETKPEPKINALCLQPLFFASRLASSRLDKALKREALRAGPPQYRAA